MRRTLATWVLPLCFLWWQPSAFGKISAPPEPLELLKNLIQINTTNPPGDETVAMEWVKNYLSGYGIESNILESAPGRGNLIARLQGESDEKSLILMAHLDVVPATPEEWTYPPFQPTLADGYLYGRGAIDMKGQAALMIAAFVRLHLEKTPLKRNVFLVLVADEESGGHYGTEYLVDRLLGEWKPSLVINEGSIGFLREGMHLYPIQVAEKGVAWIQLTAHGESGHGSMPIPDNATLRLIRALEKITRDPQPIQETPIVSAFLEGISRELSFPKSFLLKHFFSFPIRHLASRIAGSKLEAEKFFNAMVRNTVVPTVLQAGGKTNVIPPQAEAQVDCRLLPGTTPEAFLDQLKKQIDDPKVNLSFLQKNLANESPFRTRDFSLLKRAIQESDPKAVVVPFISPGATDMRFFRQKGITAYGIIPLLVTAEDLKGLHGKDERIPVDQLVQGENILFRFIQLWQGES